MATSDSATRVSIGFRAFPSLRYLHGDGPDDHEHEQDEPQRQNGRQQRSALGALHNTDDEGEQTPGGDIANRRAGQRQPAKLRSSDASIGEDSGQYREGRDRHCHAEEQREVHERHPGR
jgi:hypothetical protein